MANYWRDDFDELTKVGELVASAKDLESTDALRHLERLLAAWVLDLDLPAGAAVIAVPPGPNRTAHPVPSLAACVAETLDVDVALGLLKRENSTPRLRDTPIEGRRDVVEAAGYSVDPAVEGRNVILVDDVILTGTTLGFLAELLLSAGARSVQAVVIARTRQLRESR
ncbi:MAG: putative amidophosphoribosyltransferase [Candidatus Aldehydirespiratoraceae bacterium]|jgi:predicted amidophosphoribosyltransferase